ncbi:hypothetical protein CDAR_216561 [Caerostris darwini]|uniref:Uncharacterized protein n=1 Tax=Caerostris darwini TaxID=1538125 RepID=A0AAV4WPY4_9ARAC|nr:hypothetical protein CDAR_216561 [Caerostris darwini]
MDTTSASIPSELLASPIFHEKLSEEERCARISTVTKKKDIAQNLYDAYAAALTGYSPDDDDLKELKKHHDDLQLAMRERQANLSFAHCHLHLLIEYLIGMAQPSEMSSIALSEATGEIDENDVNATEFSPSISRH